MAITVTFSRINLNLYLTKIVHHSIYISLQIILYTTATQIFTYFLYLSLIYSASNFSQCKKMLIQN